MTLTDSQVKETHLQEELEAAKRQLNKTTNELHQAIGKQNNAFSTVIGNLEDISDISGSTFCFIKKENVTKSLLISKLLEEDFFCKKEKPRKRERAPFNFSKTRGSFKDTSSKLVERANFSENRPVSYLYPS